MYKFSAVLSQIWKKYIQKLNDWDLPLNKAWTEVSDHSDDHISILWLGKRQ